MPVISQYFVVSKQNGLTAFMDLIQLLHRTQGKKPVPSSGSNSQGTAKDNISTDYVKAWHILNQKACLAIGKLDLMGLTARLGKRPMG